MDKKSLLLYTVTVTIGLLIISLAFKWPLSGTHVEKNNEHLALLKEIKSAGKSLSMEQQDRLNLMVRAIMTQRCYQCHSSEKQKNGLALDNRDGVLAGGEEGPAIVVGKGRESDLIRRIKLKLSNPDSKEAMPAKGGPLTKEEIQLFRLWIDHGAHWADQELKVFPEAVHQLVQPALPDGNDTHPIDRWVAVYFRDHDLKWPTLISDEHFFRKASLDIRGTLPTEDELLSWSRDQGDDKRKRYIRSLLSDRPSYTLHWMTFWNDLLRNDYSGTGYITEGRKQISRWLYKSILEDKPYPQLIAELINPDAGSEGFIHGIKWRGEVNSSQSTAMQAAQNIGQSLLGLNVKCASCHNSFVNNLKLDQVYGLASVFSVSPVEIHRCDAPTGRVAAPAFIYPELGTVTGDSLADRLASLATIMTSPDNGRLYRTIVNRYWDQLFGRGLIAPTDQMDLQPWSSELLDWLAAEFRDKNLTLRQLLELIMTSKTYQLPAKDYGSSDNLLKKSFVFSGPVLRRLKAEQIADAISQNIQPMYHGVAFDTVEYRIPARWIWHHEVEFDRTVLPYPGKRFLRKTFNLSKAIIKAELLVTADHQFTLYINNQQVAQNQDYRQYQPMDVTELLSRGRNCLAAEVENEGQLPNPAGLLLHLRILHAKDTTHIYSDGSWKSAKEDPDGNWRDIKYDDQTWSPAYGYGSYAQSHWGRLQDFRFENQPPERYARAALVVADPFLKALGRPTRENVTTRRDDDPGLLQALSLTNDAFFTAAVEKGAKKWLEKYPNQPEQMINHLYLNLLSRQPSKAEREILLRYWTTRPGVEAAADMIWAILVLPEFQFI